MAWDPAGRFSGSESPGSGVGEGDERTPNRVAPGDDPGLTVLVGDARQPVPHEDAPRGGTTVNDGHPPAPVLLRRPAGEYVVLEDDSGTPF